MEGETAQVDEIVEVVQGAKPFFRVFQGDGDGLEGPFEGQQETVGTDRLPSREVFAIGPIKTQRVALLPGKGAVLQGVDAGR